MPFAFANDIRRLPIIMVTTGSGCNDSWASISHHQVNAAGIQRVKFITLSSFEG
jgi:hypothetical protein